MAAFLAALRIPGCDGLEFDVRIATDGVPVVIHDDTLDRVQGVAGRVADLTADALGAHGIPTLELVLGAIPRTAFLDIELKGDQVPATIDVISAARAAGAELSHAVVSSFEAATLEAVGAERPAWARWLNVYDLKPRTVQTALDLGCVGMSAERVAIDRESAARVADAGLDLAAYTVRRTPTFRRLAGLGVMAICAEATALDRGSG